MVVIRATSIDKKSSGLHEHQAEFTIGAEAMLALLLSLLTFTSDLPNRETVPVRTLLVKVGPMPGVSGRTPGQNRAVVLIHGLGLHPISKEKPLRADLRPWQQSDHPLVRRLAEDSDVYSLAYSQNVSIEELSACREIHQRIHSLKSSGYKEIVLIGYSAGGLLARELVEDHPELGVTRVIQVCCPNAGSGWAALKPARSTQIPFMLSLTRPNRQKLLEERYPGKSIPENVEFVCIVGTCKLRGDGIVSYQSQWSAELQAQGIPARGVKTTHWDAMTNAKTRELLGQLVVEPLPRWSAAEVIEARKSLFGN